MKSPHAVIDEARGRALRNPNGTIREWVGVNFDGFELIDIYERLLKGRTTDEKPL